MTLRTLVPGPFLNLALLAMLAGMVVAAPGCMSVDQPRRNHVGNATKQVKVGGPAIDLGEAQKPGITPDAFLQRIHELLEAEKFASARHLVARYPDVALDALRSSTARQADNPAFRALAKLYDDQCCQVDAQFGWAALVKDRADHADRYKAHDTARLQVLEHLHGGRAKEAAGIHLVGTVKDAPGQLLRIDALQLTGEALLLAERPKEAAAVFAEARKLAGSAFPHQSVKLLLLLSDAQRRAGQEAPAVAAWKEAAELAETWLNPARSLTDPGLWERIAYLRPVSSTWPGISETDVWTLIGEWRLHRAEPQGALVAFKRAESFAPDQASRDRLQLGEARALAQLGQRTAALAILNHLTDPKNSELSLPACAVLGSLLFNEGQVAEAKALLQKAVEGDPSRDWSGRAQAEADLGLACLTAGEEAEGLSHLHNAQVRFEATGEFELLQQCLWNEAAYMEHTHKGEEANSVRQRSRNLEFQSQLNSPK